MNAYYLPRGHIRALPIAQKYILAVLSGAVAGLVVIAVVVGGPAQGEVIAAVPVEPPSHASIMALIDDPSSESADSCRSTRG